MLFCNQNADHLRERCKSHNTLFVDPEFPAQLSSLSLNADFNTEYNIIWKRPSDLSSNPCLITNPNRTSSPRQGRLGNCWFVAACSCLASNSNLFDQVIPQCYTNWSDYWGIFELRFWRYDSWVKVVIDDLLPTCDGELLYCHSGDPNEYWCALLEKAYAKLLGRYESLEGGELADALVDFTGGFTEHFDLCLTDCDSHEWLLIKLDVQTKNEPTSTYFKVPVETLYQYLRDCSFNQILMAAAISADCPEDQERESASGFVIGHAYAVSQIIEIPNSSDHDDQDPIRLVQLMNPWGHNQWHGLFKTSGDDCKSTLSGLLQQHGLELQGNGQFWMLFHDFVKNFNHIVLCHPPVSNGWFQFPVKPLLSWSLESISPCSNADLVDLLHQVTQFESKMDQFNALIPYPDDQLWVERVYHSEWLPKFDGGCLNFTQSFARNPQFVINIAHPNGSWLIICLIQKTVRSINQRFSTTGLFHIGFSLFRIEGTYYVPSRIFNLKNLICSSTYRNSRSVRVRLALAFGQYLLVPTTFHPECHAPFMLRLFGTMRLSVVQINGLQYPSPQTTQSTMTNSSPPKRCATTNSLTESIRYLSRATKLFALHLKFAVIRPVSSELGALFDPVRSRDLQPLAPHVYLRLKPSDGSSTVSNGTWPAYVVPNTTCGLVVIRESFLFMLYCQPNGSRRRSMLNSVAIEMTSLLSLIESLETALTDTKISSQKDSLGQLVDGLKSTSVKDVNEKEVDCLVDFFSARLAIADPCTISILLDGFLHLAYAIRPDCSTILTSNQVQRICQQGLFQHLQIPSLTKSGRLQVFKLLHRFLTTSMIQGLQTISDDFVFHYLQSIDGEKDPENLVLIFEMNVIVMTQFQIDRFKDDLFETMLVYFPVEYNPPPGDTSSSITRSQLSSGLHRCLFASRHFAGHHLLPLICEKADSDWLLGRLDALALLADCLRGQIQGQTPIDGDDGKPIELRHVSTYLVILMPIFVKIAEQSSTRFKSSKLIELALACVSGLVHSYSSQTQDPHTLDDFVATLLKHLGISSRDKLPDPIEIPILPNSVVVDFLVRAVQDGSLTNSYLGSLLFNYLLPHLVYPLYSNCFSTEMMMDQWLEFLDRLCSWKSSFELANKLMDHCSVVDKALDRQQPDFKLQTLHSNLVNLLKHLNMALFDHHDNQTPGRLHTYCVILSLFVRLVVKTSLELFKDQSRLDLIRDSVRYLIGYMAKLDDVNSDTSLKGSKNELLFLIPYLYSNLATYFESDLDAMLLGLIGEDNPSLTFGMELLRHAACQSKSLLDRFFLFLLHKCSEPGLTIGRQSYWVDLLISLLVYGTHQLNTNPALATWLFNLLCDNSAHFCRCLLVNQDQVVTKLDDLHDVFVEATSSSKWEEQIRFLDLYKSELNQNENPNSIGFALICSIISGMCPKAIEISHPRELLNFILTGYEKLWFHTQPEMVLVQLSAKSYASVLNKCPEPLDADVSHTLGQTIERFFQPQSPTWNLLTPVWSAWCLWSLVAHPGSSRHAWIKQLVSHLINPSITDSCLVKIRTDTMEQMSGVLIPTVPSKHSIVTPLMAQKMLVWVVEPMAIQIGLLNRAYSLPNSGGDSKASDGIVKFKDALLYCYLALVTRIPAPLILDQLNQTIAHALDAITLSTCPRTQSMGLQFLSNLSKLVPQDGGGIIGQLSTNQADDLFSALPRLAQISYDMAWTQEEYTADSIASVRMSIARCLQTLISLPTHIVNRHRETQVLPLLDQLIDDSNSAVRLQAARARNSWLL